MSKKIICNSCGCNLCLQPGENMQEYIKVTKTWGYFSKKDGRTQEFVLCEDCYDAITKEFRVPVKEIQATELI